MATPGPVEKQRETEASVRVWLAATLGEPSLSDPSAQLHSLLKSGVVLCNLVRKIAGPG